MVGVAGRGIQGRENLKQKHFSMGECSGENCRVQRIWILTHVPSYKQSNTLTEKHEPKWFENSLCYISGDLF